jgi:hypothetical protein
MRNLLTTLLFITSFTAFGQISEIANCGLDQELELNEFEAKYFNEALSGGAINFDFADKVVAFYIGTSATTRSSKKQYFDVTKRVAKSDVASSSTETPTQFMMLTKEEKEISGGYDVILVYWSKLPRGQVERASLVKQLGKETMSGPK